MVYKNSLSRKGASRGMSGVELTSGRILVVGASPRQAGALSARLALYGLVTTTAASSAAAINQLRNGRFDSIVIDAEERDEAETIELCRKLRDVARPFIVPQLAIVQEGASLQRIQPHVDVVLRAPAHPAQIGARLLMATRVAVMEDEARLRAVTLSNFDQSVDLSFNIDDLHAPQILFVGPPSPFFLGLERHLRNCGGQVTGAFSTFTAFDYLHERDFDTVVTNGIDAMDRVYVMAHAFRRNTRLFHTPLCLFIDMDDFEDVEKAFKVGFSDILDARGEPRDMSSRVMSLARERRRREMVKRAFNAIRNHTLMDRETGLATPRFFAAHLRQMVQHQHATGRDLSLLLVRTFPPRKAMPADLARAHKQFSSMLSHLIRTEDLGAQLDDSVFAIAMPGSNNTQAARAAERIEAIASCTAFDAGDHGIPFQLALNTINVQRGPHENADSLLNRALQKLTGSVRPEAATS
jgi:two-component system, cell cycle response regulator PopA